MIFRGFAFSLLQTLLTELRPMPIRSLIRRKAERTQLDDSSKRFRSGQSGIFSKSQLPTTRMPGHVIVSASRRRSPGFWLGRCGIADGLLKSLSLVGVAMVRRAGTDLHNYPPCSGTTGIRICPFAKSANPRKSRMVTWCFSILTIWVSRSTRITRLTCTTVIPRKFAIWC
jgi:hypothetical protein